MLWDVCVDVHVCVCACGGQKLMLEIFLCSSLPYFMKQYLSLSLELTGSARLAGQQVPRILWTTSPSVEVTDTFHHIRLFLHRCVGGLDVGLSWTHCKHFTYWATAPGPRQLLYVILLLLKRVTACSTGWPDHKRPHLDYRYEWSLSWVLFS